jgi:hypothetical protein
MNRTSGQTLFLGASIVSYSVNVGWGGNKGSLQVELIEDFQPHKFYDTNHYNSQNSYPDNHYYNCIDDDCYTDELGIKYNNSTTKKEKNVPGKIYYEWVNNQFVSRYWYAEDPGFFAIGTRINPNGGYERDRARSLNGPGPYIYNIIDTPVYFKFDNFEFIGLVKSWDRKARPGGVTYDVTIESFDGILDNSYVILQSFNGAIFSRAFGNRGSNEITRANVGGPTNFPNPNATNYSEIVAYGNLSNIFNVYGFLESMGPNYFGGSKLNTEGLKAMDIIGSLLALTSSQNFNLRPLDRAFSPFGRILTKSISLANGSIVNSLGSFGVISSLVPNRIPLVPSQAYNSFKLDLTSLPQLPQDYRIKGDPHMSILTLIKKIVDDAGLDFTTLVIPYSGQDGTDFVIKIITIDRTVYNPIYQIPQTINNLERLGGNIIESSSFGQETNPGNNVRKLIFGGNQQRLYQVKNYKLSYNQSTYIYNTITRRFVNLSTTGQNAKNTINKIRNPDLFSTRNKILSDAVHSPNFSQLFLRDDAASTTRFAPGSMNTWGDMQVGRSENIVRGNYSNTIIQNNTTANTRFVPLSNDVISPYFGLKAESSAPVGNDTNEFRFPRPVLLDTWTNQITVVFDMNELPVLSIGEPLSVYGSLNSGGTTPSSLNGLDRQNVGAVSNQSSSVSSNIPTGPAIIGNNAIQPTRTLNYTAPGFTIKETEFRCPTFDEYLTYCLGKSIYSKPDLFVMLVNAYKSRGLFAGQQNNNATTVGDPFAGLSRDAITGNASSSQYGIPTKPITGIKTNMNMNWDMYLNHNFIKDLQILFNFIKNIGDTYYGKKYAVKSPPIASYKDSQFATIQLPSAVGNISVYQGSSQIIYDYEIADDGAWEEPGNYIDDSIVFGDNNWHVLRNDNGLIPTIVGYNSSAIIDDVTKFWCELSSDQEKKDLLSQLGSVPSDLAEGAQRTELMRRLTSFNFDCFNNQFYIPSLDVSNLDSGSYVRTPKTSNTDAFGRNVPSSKLYTAANSDQIVFVNPLNLSDPRVIVDVGAGIKLASSSYSYVSDPNLTVISNIAMEDFAILSRLLPNGISSNGVLSTNILAREKRYLSYLLSFISPIDENRLISRGSSANSSASHAMISPKMANPTFIGVPLKSNRAVYGPWTNYPGLVMNRELADNLIGNTKVELNPDYVPWVYGGMSFLDRAVAYAMEEDLNYQNILENGRVTIVGPPIFGIAGAFTYTTRPNQVSNNIAYFDNNRYIKNLFPIVFTDIPNGATLTYQILVLQQNRYGDSPIVSNISIQKAIDGIKTTYSLQTYNPKTGLFNKEFSDSIRQRNLQNLKFSKAIAQTANSIGNRTLTDKINIIERAKISRENYSTAQHASSLFGTSPVELIVGQSSEFTPVPINPVNLTQFNEKRRVHHWAGIIPGKEVGSELLADYDSKAAMSLDGLLSPISFFPTRLSTTYSISSFVSSNNCPRCSNTRKISVEYYDYSNPVGGSLPIDIPCPSCSKSRLNYNNKLLPKSTKEINIYSLNPIVVPSGEFTNSHAGAGTAKHSILAVARGENTQMNNDNFLLHHNLQNNNDNDYIGNQRFFGLRGPIMLHSWGFDTDGYPVPNATGQPLSMDNFNRPLRFVVAQDGTNDLSQRGMFVPTPGIRLGDVIPANYEFLGGQWRARSNKKSEFFHPKWAERPDLWPVGPIDLRWDDERKVWTAGGCKEEATPPFIITNQSDINTLKTFLEANKKQKCPYKMIYITLEQDMLKDNDFEITHPARGFVDDIEYTKEPLLNNYRRLVYVVDTAGYTAPKGTKLLCRYNKDTGFYEPITKPIVTALGTINGRQARIEMSYTQGRRAGNIPVYATTFDNPLNLNVKQKGLFNYINGKWILTSTG